MADTGGQGVEGQVSTAEDRNKTKEQWKPKHSEARKNKGGKYPDYFSWKTRSGHSFQLDDTMGQETVTLQHRSGTAIQMASDGTLTITAHNGRYDIVFGEDRMTVSGAQDVTIKGDASIRVHGDYNVTCQKDYNLTVLGNFNIVAKNHNRHILGNIDTQARNETKKLNGSSSKLTRGAISYVAKGSVGMMSQSDKGFFGGAAGASIWAKNGNITSNIEEQGSHYVSTKDGSINHVVDGQDGSIRMRSKQGKMEFKSKEDMNQTVETGHYKVTTDTGDIGHEAKTGSIQGTAPSGGIKQTAKNYSGNFTQSADITTQQSLDLRATGSASLSGSTTHVSGTDVQVKGSATTNIDGPTALNLNGGLSTLMSALGIQIPFNFGQVTDAEEQKNQSRGVPPPNGPAGREEADNWH